jgi:LmbE family N-acetylglucosaminyl deacetylase
VLALGLAAGVALSGDSVMSSSSSGTSCGRGAAAILRRTIPGGTGSQGTSTAEAAPGGAIPAGSGPVEPSVLPGSPSPRGWPARVLNVVAHPDDDLLFLSPDLLNSVRSGAAVRTAYLTAGDDGRPEAYWRGRERGIRAAYARMAGVSDAWHEVGSGLPALTAVALDAAPKVCLMFFRLPDGGHGHGFARHGHSSLPQLWLGEQGAINAVDGSAHYTRATLVDALAALVRRLRPQQVRTQDFHGHFGDSDHRDHHAVAFLARAASAAVAGEVRHELLSYQDYATSGRPQNVADAALAAKMSTFGDYAAEDSQVCMRGPARGFGSWLRREYLLSR